MDAMKGVFPCEVENKLFVYVKLISNFNNTVGLDIRKFCPDSTRPQGPRYLDFFRDHFKIPVQRDP